MNQWHRLILTLSWVVILTELISLVIFHRELFEWLSHHLWVVLIPVSKVILKRLLALKLVAALKGVTILMWHLGKLAVLKIFKTLGVRYGVFFTQRRWYWARFIKVMFLRRGKQFFRAASRFWNAFQKRDRWIIMLAFFPVVLLLFLLGLSFNVTRKTMVKKTQESAIFKTMTKASTTSRGIRARISQLDRWALEKIRAFNPKSR